MSKPKLLFHSNAPWAPTGYGTQTRLFAPRLAEHYDIQVSAFYGLEGSPLTFNGVKVLPGLGGTYGNEALPHHATRLFGSPRDGLVLTLMDVWVLDPNMAATFDMVCWTPVDHEPAPPGVTGFLRRSRAVPMAMSRFGAAQLAEFDPLYCPHAVDTKVYRPLDQAKARKALGIGEDRFVIGMVAANKGSPSRKCFAELLEAFAEFRRRHENALLYLHTDLDGSWSQGVTLPAVIDALGIPPDAIAHPSQHVIHFHPMSSDAMAHVYSAMDVLANPSAGEGFGIPVLEAQSCGVPCVVTDFSAMSEVCGAGWKINSGRSWSSQRSWQATPDVGDLLAALEEAYRLSPEHRRKLSDAARSHALSYDVDVVLRDHMLPSLEAAQERLGRRRPVLVEARAAA